MSAVPTGLAFGCTYPGLTSWAKLCRAFGAGWRMKDPNSLLTIWGGGKCRDRGLPRLRSGFRQKQGRLWSRPFHKQRGKPCAGAPSAPLRAGGKTGQPLRGPGGSGLPLIKSDSAGGGPFLGGKSRPDLQGPCRPAGRNLCVPFTARLKSCPPTKKNLANPVQIAAQIAGSVPPCGRDRPEAA